MYILALADSVDWISSLSNLGRRHAHVLKRALCTGWGAHSSIIGIGCCLRGLSYLWSQKSSAVGLPPCQYLFRQLCKLPRCRTTEDMMLIPCTQTPHGPLPQCLGIMEGRDTADYITQTAQGEPIHQVATTVESQDIRRQVVGYR